MPWVVLMAGVGLGAAAFGYRAGGGVADGLRVGLTGAAIGAGAYLAYRAYRG
jgi:hypothetical protein